MRSRRKLSIIALLALLLTVMLAPSVLAQADDGPRRKFRAGGDITIEADETVPHDLYVSGGRVRVDGRIQGDLVVAGGRVEVNGPVEGDLAAVGGQVTITGPVDGDVRAAGGTVQIEGTVREDVLAGAGTLTIAESAQIGQDLIFGAGTARINGTVAGGIEGGTSNYERSGTVSGAEDVTIREDEEPTIAERLVDQLRRYLIIVGFGLLLLWLAPRVTGAAAAALRERPLPSVGVGLLTIVIVIAILIALLIVTVIFSIIFGLLGFGELVATAIAGALLGGGLLSFVLIVTAAFLALAVVGFVVGRLLLRPVSPAAAVQPALTLLLGALVIVALTAIPLVGVALNWIAALFGLGALVLALRRRQTATPA